MLKFFERITCFTSRDDLKTFIFALKIQKKRLINIKLFETKKLIFNFFVNRNWKKLADSRKRAKILADNRKYHHPIETLGIWYIQSGGKGYRTGSSYWARPWQDATRTPVLIKQ